MKFCKVICILSAFLVLFAAGGCTPQGSNALGSTTLSVPTYAVKAPAAGKLLGLISEKGERISKGQPLFAVSANAVDSKVKDVTTQLAKAEADLKRMEVGTSAPVPAGDLAAAQANVAAAQQKAAKMNSLLAQGAVSRNQAQAAQNELVAATLALQAASSTAVQTKPAAPEQIAAQKKLVEQLKQQQAASLAQQQQNEGVSPCTGIITELAAKNNDNVQKDQVILHIKSTTSCSLTLNVSAAKAKELQKGQGVSIKAEAVPAPFAGKISAIDGSKITITSDNKPEDLADGTKVEVSLAG